MATRDPAEKRRMLLQAATLEFSAYGLAGARIDRIAAAAGCSVGLVYTYFSNKEGLFEATFEYAAANVVQSVPISPEDLPGYTERLYKSAQMNPHAARIAAWYTLERRDKVLRAKAVEGAVQAKVDAIKAAQSSGLVTKDLTAEQIVLTVQHLAAIWSQPVEVLNVIDPENDSEMRIHTIHELVKRVLGPAL